MTVEEYEATLTSMREERIARETARQLEAQSQLEQRRNIESGEPHQAEQRTFRVERVDEPFLENGRWTVYIHMTDDITIRPTPHLFSTQAEAQAFYDEMKTA